jgi:hypothetical protein
MPFLPQAGLMLPPQRSPQVPLTDSRLLRRAYLFLGLIEDSLAMLLQP